MNSESKQKVLAVVYSFVLAGTAAMYIFKKEYYYLYEIFSFLLFYYAAISGITLKKLRIPPWMHLLAVLTLLAHIVLGRAMRFYDLHENFDNFLHFFGAFSFSVLTFEILRGLSQDFHIGGFSALVVTFLLGTALGVSFEFLEFALDVVTSSHHQRGLLDTDLDLLFNVMGAAAAGAYVGIWRYPRI